MAISIVTSLMGTASSERSTLDFKHCQRSDCLLLDAEIRNPSFIQGLKVRECRRCC